MALLTKVKAGSISTLSDARYFAGMGIEWLGFSVDPDSEAFVSVEQYKSFVGWVTGPKRVIELPSNLDKVDLTKVREEYLPEYFEVDYAGVNALPNDLPLFVRLNDIESAKALPGHVEYIILNNTTALRELQTLKSIGLKAKIILNVSPDFRELNSLISEGLIDGIALHGSKEIQTGIKVYDYSDLLESIDSDV